MTEVRKLTHKEVCQIISGIYRHADKCMFSVMWDDSTGEQLGGKNVVEVCAVDIGDFTIHVIHHNETRGYPLGYHPEYYCMEVFLGLALVAESERGKRPILVSFFEYVFKRGRKAVTERKKKNQARIQELFDFLK